MRDQKKILAAAAAAVLLAVSLSGCTLATRSAQEAVQAAAARARQMEASTAPTAPTAPVTPGAVVVANGHGWTSAGLDGPVPAPATCRDAGSAVGGELPDASCTPGSVDSTVTEANVDSTLGRPGGYTSSVRPPEALTETAKKQLMAAYGIPWSEARDYELDHLVPLCAAGSSDVRNLWPEKNDFLAGDGGATAFVHNSKDRVEDYVCQAIRSHQVPLTAAQQAMASNWTTAVATLRLPPIPAGYDG